MTSDKQHNYYLPKIVISTNKIVDKEDKTVVQPLIKHEIESDVIPIEKPILNQKYLPITIQFPSLIFSVEWRTEDGSLSGNLCRVMPCDVVRQESIDYTHKTMVFDKDGSISLSSCYEIIGGAVEIPDKHHRVFIEPYPCKDIKYYPQDVSLASHKLFLVKANSCKRNGVSCQVHWALIRMVAASYVYGFAMMRTYVISIAIVVPDKMSSKIDQIFQIVNPKVQLTHEISCIKITRKVSKQSNFIDLSATNKTLPQPLPPKSEESVLSKSETPLETKMNQEDPESLVSSDESVSEEETDPIMQTYN